jgi:hypothetical protein
MPDFAAVGADRDEHADETGEPRQDGADGEADGGLDTKGSRQQCQDNEDDHANNGDDGVLALHVGAGPLLDGGGDLAHPLVALGKTQYPLGGDQPVHDGRNGAGQGEINC